MADIQTKNFATLVSEQAASIQGGSTSLVDLTIGSILRAIVEAYSAVALWLQALILKVLALTRAATSTGADLDSWMADYGLVRLPAALATSLETFSRFTPTAQAIVPVGALVQTADGTQQYEVVIDTTNTAYNAALGGYVVGAGVPSVSAPVQALIAGKGANASAGSISVLAQAIAGIDTVTNPSAVSNGEDPETDAALRRRFVAYLASLSKATKAAVGYATTSVETGITYTLVENQNYDGSARLGFFYVVADDGSGSPPTSLLNSIYAAIDAVRPVSVSFAVYPPVVVPASVFMIVTVAAGFDGQTIATTVQNAVAAYINGLSLGTDLAWSRLYQVAYDASPAVVDVSGLTINGAQIDVPATSNQVIKAGTVSAATVS